jgi:membrane fusion protein, multidrug efflux system
MTDERVITTEAADTSGPRRDGGERRTGPRAARAPENPPREEEAAAHPQPRPTGRPRRRYIVLAAAVLIAAVVGFFLWRHYSVRESTDDAQIDGHIHTLAAMVGGTIEGVFVHDNQHVDAGTRLVQIDRRSYEAAVAKARADLADAIAEAEAARTGVPVASTTMTSQVSGAESDVAMARARLRSAQAKTRESEVRRTKAQQDRARFEQLVAKDEVSKQEYEAAVVAAEAAGAEHETAQAAVHEAEEAVAAAEARLRQARTAPEQVSITRSHAASAEAKVEQARATLAQAELDLEHTSVVAPVAGVVNKRSAEVGQVVQAGQPLIAVVPLEDVWVTANFKESQLRHMRPGQPAEITVDAYGGRKYRGHVESIAPATGARFSLLPPENASGNFVKVVQRVPVKIVLEKDQDPEHQLRPGMSAVPTVLTR